VTVVAEAPVGLGGIRAGAGVRVARPGLVTLIRGGAEDRGTPLAGAVLAGVGPRAGVPVVAERAITLGGALTLRGGLVADGAVACVGVPRRPLAAVRRPVAGAVVALVACGAAVPRRPAAHAPRADVAHGAEGAIVARRTVRLRGVRARPGEGVTGPGVVTLIGGRAGDRIAASADAGLADVAPRAGLRGAAAAAVGRG